MTYSYDPLDSEKQLVLDLLFTDIFTIIAEALWMWTSRFRCERLESLPEVISSVGNGFELAHEGCETQN